MPRLQWTTSEQFEWLSERIPDFTEAQQAGTLATFYLSLIQKWIQKNPLEDPTDEELQKAKGSAAAARKTQIEYWKKVSGENSCIETY